ncbi:MAG: alpha/beta fold hydrolase [Anaerolineae bacterium]
MTNTSTNYSHLNDLPRIMPGGEPFFFKGGRIGVLCLHGFTASPSEVRWLGEHIADQGWTVHGPRLPGHATNPHDLTRYRWQDWYAGALDGCHFLRAHCEQVYVVGHSMGGLLALLLAAGGVVDGAVAMAAPVLFRSRAMALSKWIKWVLPYTDQSDKTHLTELVRSLQAERGEAVLGRVRYNLWSTAAVAQLYALSAVVRTHLERIQKPLMLLYSEGDLTVPLENRDYILGQVKSSTIEQHTLKESDHILPQDHERETVFALVADFVKRQTEGLD